VLEFIQVLFSPTLNEACLFENKGHAMYCFVSKLVEEKENGNIMQDKNQLDATKCWFIDSTCFEHYYAHI
jgi:hypothetical protein